MIIKSLGYRSDLVIAKFDGEIIDRGEYTVVKTANNPNYYWGNYLLFDKAPQIGDYAKWTELFKNEFADLKTNHVALGWESPQGELGDLSEFQTQGFELETGVVLAAQAVHLPAKNNSKIAVKPIVKDEDWETAIRINVDTGLIGVSKEKRLAFYRAHMKRYEKMVDKKHGHYFGAYLEGKLVASLGIFKEAFIGRFQLVSTDPQYQRQGIAGTLVFYAAQFALKHMGLKALVIVADEDSHAVRVYESVGFQVVEKMYGVCWQNKEASSTP